MVGEAPARASPVRQPRNPVRAGGPGRRDRAAQIEFPQGYVHDLGVLSVVLRVTGGQFISGTYKDSALPKGRAEV